MPFAGAALAMTGRGAWRFGKLCVRHDGAGLLRCSRSREPLGEHLKGDFQFPVIHFVKRFLPCAVQYPV
jgi:hypothetical protein